MGRQFWENRRPNNFFFIKLGQWLQENRCPIKFCFVFFFIFTAVKKHRNSIETIRIRTTITIQQNDDQARAWSSSSSLHKNFPSQVCEVPPLFLLSVFSLISYPFFAILDSFFFFIQARSFCIKIFKDW